MKVVNSEAGTAATTTTTALEAIDFTVIAYNKFGGTVATNAPTLGAVSVDGTADGMHFTADLGSVADTTDITRVLLVLKKDVVELADLIDATRH